MRGELFDSTIPFGDPELMRASGYQLYLDELSAETAPGGISARISSLSPSLQADLLRFEQVGGGSEAVEVMAACLRHAKRVTMHMQCGERVVPLTVFARERLVHCPISVAELVENHLPALRVMHVEPALLRPPGDADRALVPPAEQLHPLAPLLWELAMRGARSELLPEIAGPAVYRVAPALNLHHLPVGEALTESVLRLRRQPANLQEIADWPGMTRECASRFLNALYLQAGLIVSRSHPGAVRDGWFS